ncbi:MAG: aminotransferase class I/II-fold pyridoxal phosphate-dependent enzyme, partial [Candidatus Dojkabacteria bacterium]|nr:aminotransferase class I/II-fold pyridoxal phosphate-dependent enzyme [Candidatus Dojkabacteria bacterium]
YTHSKPFRLYWRENYSEKPKVVKNAVERAVAESKQNIHLYPGLLYDEVVALIAKDNKLSPNQVILGHGAEGIIHKISEAFLSKDKTGGIFEPSYFVFNNNISRYKSIRFPCSYDSQVNFEEFVQRIKDTNVFFLASPNTETGNYLLTKKQIKKLLKVYKGILVVDECYYGIGHLTVLDLLKKHKNLIILRSITKLMGMGGLRLGYAFSNPEIISQLNYNFREIELDPINSFSLNIFKYTYKYYDTLARGLLSFKELFFAYVSEQFPDNKIYKNVTNFIFLDKGDCKIPTFEILNSLSRKGYVYSEKPLRDNSTLHFPELIELTPPPKEYWEDFVTGLKKAMSFNN